MVRVDDAGTPAQAGVPRVGSTRLTVSYPTANGGSDALVRPSDDRELAAPDRPPAARTSTATISTSTAFRRGVDLMRSSWPSSSRLVSARCHERLVRHADPLQDHWLHHLPLQQGRVRGPLLRLSHYATLGTQRDARPERRVEDAPEVPIGVNRAPPRLGVAPRVRRLPLRRSGVSRNRLNVAN